jgi:N-acetylmuramoyl-L-alanine amidase
MNYVKRFTVLIAFFICLPLPSLTSHANSVHTFEVGTQWLNVRNSPSPNSEVIGKLKKGNKVKIFQEKSGWVQTYFNGVEGWVASKHLIPVGEAEVFLTDGLLAGYTIVIDPGHGGRDPGAVGHNGVLEKDLILDTSLKIAEKLKTIGATVILTRDDDSFVSLYDRVLISNQEDTDAFISIHYNAFPEDYVGGINTYYHQSGKQLAEKIQQAVYKEVLLRDRGVIQSNYSVLRDNHKPAILIELGFITNSTELATLQTDSYQEKVARGIVIGLIEYFFE